MASSTSSPLTGLKSAADLVSGPGGSGEITAANIADQKNIKLPVIGNLGNEGSKIVRGILNTTAMPQREAGSLLSGDGLVNPYGEDAANYDPSKLLGLGGLAAVGADILLDPSWLIPGVDVVKAGLSGEKALSFGSKAVKGAAEADAVAGGAATAVADRSANVLASKASDQATKVAESQKALDAASEAPKQAAQARTNAQVLAARIRQGRKSLARVSQKIADTSRKAGKQEVRSSNAVARHEAQMFKQDNTWNKLNAERSQLSRDKKAANRYVEQLKNEKQGRSLLGVTKQDIETAQLEARQAANKHAKAHQNVLDHENVLRTQDAEAAAKKAGLPGDRVPGQTPGTELPNPLDIGTAPRNSLDRLGKTEGDIAELSGRKTALEQQIAEHEAELTNQLKLAKQGNTAASVAEVKRAQAVLAKDQKALDELNKAISSSTSEAALKAGVHDAEMAKIIDDSLASAGPNGIAIRGRLPFTTKRATVATIKSDTLAQGLGGLSKIPFAGRAINAIDEGFNSTHGIDPGVAKAGQVAHALSSQTASREGAYLSKLKDRVGKADDQRLNEIAHIFNDRDKALMPGDSPELWRKMANDPKVDSKRAADLKKAADNWDQLGDNAKELYQELRKYFNADAERRLASGELINTRNNYWPAVEPKARPETPPVYESSEGTKIKTEDQFQKMKTKSGLPDNFDYWNAVETHLRGVSNTRVNRMLMDGIAFKFGKTQSEVEKLDGEWVKLAGVSHRYDYPIFVEKKIADSVSNLARFSSDPTAKHAVGRFVQWLSSKWKMAAYSSNPGHFVTDTTGDVMNTVIRLGVGAMNPVRAKRVVKEQDKVEKYLRAIEDPSLTAEGLKKLNDETIRLGGRTYRLGEIGTALSAHGLRDTSFAVAGDLGTNISARRALTKKRVVRSGNAKMQEWGNRRDNFSKRWAFLTGLDMGGKHFDEAGAALAAAAADVRMSLFDYGDLAPFEKKVARNVVPFYTWTRKNVPYQFKQLLDRPALVTAPFKAQRDLMEGDPNANKPWLTPDYVAQKYLRVGKLPGPVASFLGQPKNQPFFLNPSLPQFDLSYGQGASGGVDLQSMLSQVNPYIRVPLELATKTNLQTGRPMDAQLLANNGGIPLLGPGGEYAFKNLGGQIGGATVKAVDPNRSPLNQKLPLIGMATGIRGTSVDPVLQQQYAEAELRDMRGTAIKRLQAAQKLPAQAAIDEMNRKRRAAKEAEKLLRGSKNSRLKDASSLLTP